jgi:hypothetical protein
MCFSVAWLVQLAVTLVLICGFVAIAMLLVPIFLSWLGWAGAVAMQVIRIVVAVIVLIFIIYFLYDLYVCFVGGGAPRLR